MASLTKKSSSQNWIACFTDAAGKRCQRSTGVADEGSPDERSKARRKALAVASEYEIAARGEATESQIRKTLTELFNKVNPERRLEWAKAKEYLERWIDRVGVRKAKGTHVRYERVVEQFLQSLGPKAEGQLGDVTAEDVGNFLDAGVKAGKRPGTLRVELKILNAAFAHALRQGLIIINPVAAAEAPDGASESKRPFTVAQVRALLAACDPAGWETGEKVPSAPLVEWRLAILTAALTGLRLGDVVRLRWLNIDLASKLIEVRPVKTQRKGRDIRAPLHPNLEEALTALPASDDPNTLLMPNLAGTRIGGRSGLSLDFQKIMRKAGVENRLLGAAAAGRKVQAYTFHSLRHFFNTELAEAGVAQDVRMSLSGHSSAKTSELYTHRRAETLKQAISKLPTVV